MDPLSPALTVLAAMITPAVLISACGTLLLSTSTRLLRVADRVHAWSDQLEALAREPSENELGREKRVLVLAQLGEMTRRVRLLQRALAVLYLAVGAFVADVVVLGLAELARVHTTWPPVALALLGSGLLFAGSALLIAEARHAVAVADREMDFIRRHLPPEPPA